MKSLLVIFLCAILGFMVFAVGPLETTRKTISALGYVMARTRADFNEAGIHSPLGRERDLVGVARGSSEDVYYNGQPYDRWVRKEDSESLKWLIRAAEHGDPKAQYELSLVYKKGFWVRRNDVEALKWLRRAAFHGNAKAQYDLSLLYKRGRWIRERDLVCVPRGDFEEVSDVYGSEHATTPYDLNVSYIQTRVVRKTNPETLKWLRRAADNGNIDAEFNLGVQYAKGYGVEKNSDEAIKWLRRAADHGHSNAQSNLGAMYATGIGVEKDYDEAYKWFHRAAVHGNSNAQYNLGVMYATGTGVLRNDVEALKWYRLSAHKGFFKAKNNLRLLVQRDLR